MSKRLNVLLIIALSLVLTACSTESGGQGGNNTVSLYSPETPDMTNEMKEQFEELYGGTVNIQYAGTNVLVNRMIAEMDNPQADVWYGGGGILPFEAAVERGFITPYIPEAVKDWDVYENGIKVRHEDWYWVGTEIFVLGFVYNTDLLDESELPRTWDDLLDPKWKGKLQMPNPAASGTATLLVLSQMMERGEEAAWEYFDQLVEQMNAIPDSGGAPTRAVATGEALIGIGFDFMAYQNKARGESVDFIVPETTPILVNPVSLVKDGPNPEGGKAFIDYMLSEEGQQLKADWYHIPIMPGIESKSPLSLESLEGHAQQLDIDWVVENYDRIRNEWRERYQ
ncbi:iron(III) transport system substrate-binding protein [Caldalkalibacillus uzonensis]|uniref:Iron(III) transport system substrate-binding protein n=1 Tax=Caldalkalibacillus uzonensis TaxID=353224 RepID=A0ABU0CWR4_9BACI|nr:extracellular solute-binding protein [Caldalkalibacillus uzonensis]MDQ0340587.1 iron(III) transport system substrate-binding protein [Caldalkalibacillus uzonensis]